MLPIEKQVWKDGAQCLMNSTKILVVVPRYKAPSPRRPEKDSGTGAPTFRKQKNEQATLVHRQTCRPLFALKKTILAFGDVYVHLRPDGI